MMESVNDMEFFGVYYNIMEMAQTKDNPSIVNGTEGTDKRREWSRKHIFTIQAYTMRSLNLYHPYTYLKRISPISVESR